MRPRLFLLLQITGIAFAVYLAAQAVIAFLAPESLWKMPQTPAQPTAAQTRQHHTQLDFNFDPFHRNAAENQDIIEVGTGAPETTLNLKLVGRRASENGSAILQTSDGAQRRYDIGDDIMDGVTLKAVKADYVVIAQGGRIERLSMPRGEASFLSQQQQEAPDDQSPLITTSAPSAAGAALEALMDNITLTRVGDAGAVRGYRISPKAGFSGLPHIGLASGDILTAVGSLDVTSVNFNPVQLASALSGRKIVTVTLIRDEKPIRVTLAK